MGQTQISGHLENNWAALPYMSVSCKTRKDGDLSVPDGRRLEGQYSKQKVQPWNGSWTRKKSAREISFSFFFVILYFFLKADLPGPTKLG